MAAISTTDVFDAPRAPLTDSTPDINSSFWRSAGRLGVLSHMAQISVVMLVAIASIIAVALLSGASLSNIESLSHPAIMTTIALVALPMIWLSITMFIRRLHDLNMNAWLILLNLIPIIGSVFYLVVICVPGKKDDNKHGAPRETEVWESVVGGFGLVLMVGITLVSVVATVAPSLLLNFI